MYAISLPQSALPSDDGDIFLCLRSGCGTWGPCWPCRVGQEGLPVQTPMTHRGHKAMWIPILALEWRNFLMSPVRLAGSYRAVVSEGLWGGLAPAQTTWP